MAIEATLTDDIDEFKESMLDIDVDDARRRSTERAMEELRDIMLRKIRRKGLIGRNTNDNRGPGPELSSRRAWRIQSLGNGKFQLRTRDIVADRAFFLEFGTTFPTPTDHETMKFENTKGETIYPEIVSGVEEQMFYREAIAEFTGRGGFANLFKTELEREFAKSFGASPEAFR